jgi:hypothetical protein
LKKKYLQFFLLFGLALLAGSCSTAKYISQEQLLLTSNKINFVKDIDYDNKFLLETELASFYLQEPNGNLFWAIPREWFYFKNSGAGDTCWYNDWGKNSLGESPVYLDENLTRETAISMQKFLRNTRGFYQATVNYKIIKDQHRSKVIYNIDPGDRYYVNSIAYIGNDTNIVNIVKSISAETLLEKGDPLEADAFNSEKTRIITELQNRGYANFLPNYLKINGDSTGHNYLVDVFFQVLPPLPDTLHRQFKVGKINVYTDYYTEQNLAVLDFENLDGISYFREANNFLVKSRMIASKIYLKSGDLWSISNYNKTFRKLSELSVYRFVSLIPKREGNLINYDIYLTPHIHKYISDSGFDINYSSVNTPTGRQLFGISGNALLNIRNPFKGSEQYSLILDNGYEFNLDSLNLSTFTLGINNKLEFPKHVDYLGNVGLVKLVNRMGLMSDDRFTNIKEESSTDFNLGANYTNIRNFYTIKSINAAAIYNYSPSNRKRFSIRQTNFSLNSASLENRFLTQINNNPLIINSFADNLITGFIFNEFSFVTNSLVSPSGWSRSLLGSFEISGLEISLSNFLAKKIGGNDNTWKFSDQISFAKFVKAEIDSRFYKRVSQKNSLAFRFNGGIAIPFGPKSTIPFIRQFSVGGPNSLRAWNQKELGPGGYPDLLEGTERRQAFFQQGDIKLELNAEYRFSLGWILEGALFVDAGNVWTLKNDDLRENANFTSTFYKQMAVAMGYGMRFDFEYFNIRFDFAYRIRNPYPDSDTENYWYSWNEIKEQGFGNLQIAINHPF